MSANLVKWEMPSNRPLDFFSGLSLIFPLRGLVSPYPLHNRGPLFCAPILTARITGHVLCVRQYSPCFTTARCNRYWCFHQDHTVSNLRDGCDTGQSSSRQHVALLTHGPCILSIRILRPAGLSSQAAEPHGVRTTSESDT